jgi:acyl-CoA reductase-like NAD-dependent aldehyde dehydrogenase
MTKPVITRRRDDCCHTFAFGKAGPSGVWCSQTKRVVVDGQVIGHCQTLEELEHRLAKKIITAPLVYLT